MSRPNKKQTTNESFHDQSDNGSIYTQAEYDALIDAEDEAELGLEHLDDNWQPEAEGVIGAVAQDVKQLNADLVTDVQPTASTLPPINALKMPDLKTKSAKIRWLTSLGYSRRQIADFLGILYQHVRNIQMQVPKRAAQEALPPAVIELSGDTQMTTTNFEDAPMLEDLGLTDPVEA